LKKAENTTRTSSSTFKALAFNCIWHYGMWRVRQNAGILEQLIKPVHGIYQKSSSAITVDKKITEYFHM